MLVAKPGVDIVDFSASHERSGRVREKKQISRLPFKIPFSTPTIPVSTNTFHLVSMSCLYCSFLKTTSLGKGRQGVCIKDSWTKPKRGRWGKWGQLYSEKQLKKKEEKKNKDH